MKNSLEPVVQMKAGKGQKEAQQDGKKKRQTMYEQYEESGSDQEWSSQQESNSLSNEEHRPGYNTMLPSGLATKISREARETMQECVTEFLLFITSEAQEICETNKRKTIQGEDVI